jgi:hypothetical protein
MICGIRFDNIISNYNEWLSKVKINFEYRIDSNSEVLCRPYPNRNVYTKEAKYKGYRLVLKETCDLNGKSLSYRLIVRGSLQGQCYRNGQLRPFTYTDLREEIIGLCMALHLSPSQCTIRNIEVSVNVNLPYSASEYCMNSLLSYKGEPFIAYDKTKGKSLGVVCKMEQYWVKVYSKSLQYGLPSHLLRVEVKIKRMQKIADYSIKTLSDLMIKSRVMPLLTLVLKSWNNILVFDLACIDSLSLKRRDRELLLCGRSRDWKAQLKNPKLYDKKRSKFRNLVKLYGVGSQSEIASLLEKQWHFLINGGVFYN